MLTDRQQHLYTTFYESSHNNSKAPRHVGHNAVYAMNCAPYTLKQTQKTDITQGELQEVRAKVMAVAAGQKRLQASEDCTNYKIDLVAYE